MDKIKYVRRIHRALILVGGLAILVGIASIVLGVRQVEQVRQLAAEGRMVQGRYLHTTFDSDSTDRVYVAYRAGGRAYETSAIVSNGRHSAPLIGGEFIDSPRWGPPAHYQVIYLPADPSVARLRDDLEVGTLPIYLTGGFFAALGAAFVLVGSLVFGRLVRRIGIDAGEPGQPPKLHRQP